MQTSIVVGFGKIIEQIGQVARSHYQPGNEQINKYITPQYRIEPAAYVHGDTGIVICFEQIEDQFLIATNIFVRDGRIWKMVHHQSGPTADVPEIDPDDEPDLVN